MICTHVQVGNVHAIVCGSRPSAKRCRQCGKAADRECDFPVRDGKTCDLPICRRCSSRPSMDVDICPNHRLCLGSLAADKQKAFLDEMRRASEQRRKTPAK